MRREQRRRVGRRDQVEQYPGQKHETGRVTRKKVTLSWSRYDREYRPEHRMSVWMARYMRTGQRPVVVRSRVSVAQRRVKEGDPVGCKVDRNGTNGRRRREERGRRARPNARPFEGRPRKRRDKTGGRTLHREQPATRPGVMPYYDQRYRVLTKSTGPKSSARKRTVHTTGKNRDEVRRRRAERKRPRVEKAEQGARGTAARGVRVKGTK
jgi:ribosomal protein L5